MASSASSLLKAKSPKGSSSLQINKQNIKPLTHTNTDTHCLPTKHNKVQHWLYLGRLYNGFYMLTAREQFFCHIGGWIVALMAGLYFYVFVCGFMNGFQQQLMLVEA